MPIYEYECERCGKITEIISGLSGNVRPSCGSCKSTEVKRILSAHSPVSGARKNRLPGHGDTACCGASVGEAGCGGQEGCRGLGSCCGDF